MAERGETECEVASFVSDLMAKARRVDLSEPRLDVCGTGGSGLTRFNVSTCVAFICAAAGVPVVRLQVESAQLYRECGATTELESISKRGLGCFKQLFPPTHFNFDSALSELAAPLCRHLGIDPGTFAQPTIEDIRQLANGPAQLHGRALRFAARVAVDFPDDERAS